MKKSFYGWWVTAAAFITFGLSVGLPYYNISFFYDYFEKTYGWSKAQITFGFPLAAILTLWIGPIIIPRFSPRKLILVGTGLTCLAFLGFGNMTGSIYVYWGLWFVYTVGYILSGPIPHQIIIAQWFRKNRGKAMGVVYVGVGLIGFTGSFMVKPLTENLTAGQALMVMGALLLLAWPFAIFVLRDKPAEKGQYPDGADTPPAEILVASHSYKYLVHRYSFWLLVLGSACSIGSIGAVNFHMKFVFQDQLDANVKTPERARTFAARDGLTDPATDKTVEDLKQLGPYIASTGIHQAELAKAAKNPEEFRSLAQRQGVAEPEQDGVRKALEQLLAWLQKLLNSTWRAASMIILASSIGGRLLIGAFSDKFNKKWVMTISYFLSALTIPLLLMTVTPPATPWVFALLFGFAMGADYMLIPLMAAEQFGVNSLARCMAIILPVNTIAQTWFPYFVSLLRENFGSYAIAMGVVFVVALMSALSIALLPKRERKMRNFTYKTLEELRQTAERLGAAHVFLEPGREEVKRALARKVALRSFTLGNSLATHPMEGCDATLDGRPDELTWRRYQRFAAGGVKLIWFEATAICQEGRANPRQAWLNRDTVSDFARLHDRMLAVHLERWGEAGDLLIPMQLTHSGRYSHPRRIIAYHNPLIDRKTATPADYPVITDDELERLEDQFVEAAGLALEAGFRAIDLKVTHGYLLSELMGAKTREGRYGGSLANRTRFMRNVLGKIRASFGGRLILCMRLGCFDCIPYDRDPETGIGRPVGHPIPYPWGFGVDPNDPLREDLTEVKQAVAWFQQWGIQLLNVSAGSPYYNPHIGRPFEKPDEGNYEPPEHPLLGVDRHFRIAGELQRAFPDLPMVGTGYSWLQKYSINAGARNIADGNIRVMGLGRGVLAYPDYAADALEKGELDELRVCKTLTYCTYLMRGKNHPLGQFPTGCPPFDKDVYGPIMKQAREAKRQA